MKPDKTSAVHLFSSPLQYVIPVFQRGYVWTLEKQVAPLWSDLEDRATCWLERQRLLNTQGAAQLAPMRKHFLGSVVLTPINGAFGRVTAYEVIDGQQRTTTLHLLLLAFRHAANALGDGQLSQMLASLVRNPGPFGVASDFYKVWPTKAGRDEIGFLNQAESADAVCSEFKVLVGKQRSERPLMVQAYLYLYQAILAFLAGKSMDAPQSDETESTISDGVIHSVRRDNQPRLPVEDLALSAERAQALYMALQEAVQIMTLTLENEDDPQIIFETLNARGEPLLASDLIRNFVFLDAARRNFEVSKLYENFWQGFDEQRDQNDRVTSNRYWREKERQGRITHPRIDLFFFHYTILRCKRETKVSHVFQSFKEWWQCESRNIELELKKIVTSAKHFKELISPDGVGYLAEFARLIKVLDVSTLTPVYLFLREHYPADHPLLHQAINDLASYITRRAVCGFTTKNYNRIFLRILELISASETNEPASVLRSHLLGLGGHSQCWPNDQEFEEHWRNRPVYTELRPAKTAAVLRALEVAGRTSKQESDIVPTIDRLSVEHLLPQGWETSGHYPLPDLLTNEQKSKINRLLHTFGNLTLLTQSLNSAVSNGPFLDIHDQDNKKLGDGKRTQICSQSLLKMNTYFQTIDQWGEAEITFRTKQLFDQAKRVWRYPAE